MLSNVYEWHLVIQEECTSQRPQQPFVVAAVRKVRPKREGLQQRASCVRTADNPEAAAMKGAQPGLYTWMYQLDPSTGCTFLEHEAAFVDNMMGWPDCTSIWIRETHARHPIEVIGVQLIVLHED